MKKVFTILALILLLASGSWADVLKIDGTTNVEDARIASVAANYNYGSNNYLVIQSTSDYVLIRVKNLSALLPVNATISSCVCSLYCQNNNTDGNVSAYRVFKPWGEGTNIWETCNTSGASWNDWVCIDFEWGTAGCNNASDAGSDNSGDGTDYDRKATAEVTVNVTTVNTWYGWSISTALAQGWYDGTINEEGIILISDGAANNTFYSTEYTTDATKCPVWTITYTVAAEEDVMRVPDDWQFKTAFWDWQFQEQVAEEEDFGYGLIKLVHKNRLVRIVDSLKVIQIVGERSE